MRYVQISGTDLKTAAIVMGSICSVEGSVENAWKILDMYREAGGNMLDSANVYGKFFPAGTNVCDRHIGNWLKQRNCRNEFIVVTKGGHPDPKKPEISRLRKEDIQADLEESLKALQTDVIDLFFLHRDDVKLPAGEIIEYLNEFKKEGKIRYFGTSNWSAKRIEAGQNYAQAHGLQGFSANQTLWSMADAQMEYYPWPGCTNMDEAAYQMHERTGLMAFAYESQARGFFQKYHNRAQTAVPENLQKLYGSAKNIARYERALHLAEKKQTTLTAITLAYLLHSPFPSAALIGPRTVEQYQESIAAAELSLSKEEMQYLRG